MPTTPQAKKARAALRFYRSHAPLLIVIHKCLEVRHFGMDVVEIAIHGTGYPLPGEYDGLLEPKAAVEYSKIPFALSPSAPLRRALSKGERDFGILTKWVRAWKPFMLRQAQHERLPRASTAVFRLKCV